MPHDTVGDAEDPRELRERLRVGVDGRLDWREWDAQDGTKRQAVEIIADTVQFLGSRDGGGGGGAGDGERQFVPAAATAGNEDFTSSSADDDIPF